MASGARVRSFTYDSRAAGGRTVAVLGTGILKMYPPETRDLAERIIRAGGLGLSQF